MSLDLSANAAPARLEPFLLMAKAAKGAAAAKLIADATSAPGIFVFGELLEMPNVQALEKSEQKAYLKLLRIFAYGTLENYNNEKDSLPALNQAQLTKLRLLTIISLALDRRILPYDLLLRTLHLPTIRELEDLVIDGIYLDILRGRLDQKRQQVEVEYAIGRDLAPGGAQSLLESLKNWAHTTSSVLATLDAQLAGLAAQSASAQHTREEQDRVGRAVLTEVRREIKSFASERGGMRLAGRMGGSGQGTGTGMGEEAMDVDEPRAGGNVGAGGLLGALSGDGKARKFKMPEYGKPTARKRNRF